MKKFFIAVGLILGIISAAIFTQQITTEGNETARITTEGNGTVQITTERNETVLPNQTEPVKAQRKKSEFTCDKPPILCFCKNFLSFNKEITNKSDLDEAIQLFLDENHLRREDTSIKIEENAQRKGWYFVKVMNMTFPYTQYIFHIDNSTGDFWYLFGCV